MDYRATARHRVLIAPASALALLALLSWGGIERSGAKRTAQAGPSVGTAAASVAEIGRARRQGPLRFEQNLGQTDPRVRFLARAPGHTLFLTRTEAVLSLAAAGDRRSRRAVVRMRLAGANRHPAIEGLGRLAGTSNYYRGADRRRWRSGVPGFGRVRYRGVYPGIDLVYRSGRGRLEYDFVLAPGAEPGRIAVTFGGARRLSLTAKGDLLLRTRGGTLRQRRPFVYQRVRGERRRVAGRFVLRGRNRVGFELGRYDRARRLVIDPEISYATYLGGSKNDDGQAIAVDGAGNAYVTGVTESADFPTAGSGAGTTHAGGRADAFVTKLAADGSELVYSTYLGGTKDEGGSAFGQQRGAIAVDPAGNAYVTGATNSTDFPTTEGVHKPTVPTAGFEWGFLTRLDGTGRTVRSTYLEGRGSAIAVDPAGSAYVIAGGTKKLSADLSTLVYSTTLAFGNGIAVDGSGHAYVTGAKTSKLNPAGSALVYSLDFGGTGAGIAVDGSGAAYVTGTADDDFQTTPGAYQEAKSGGCFTLPEGGGYCLPDAFATKIGPSGAIAYSTYLGRTGADYGRAVGVDASGDVYVAGNTTSEDFPAGGRTRHSGVLDAYLARLNETGSELVGFTYLGGSGHESGSGLAVDPAGNAYITGKTESNDFAWTEPLPSVTAAPHAANAYVAKIAPSVSRAAITAIRPRGGPASGGTEVTISGMGFAGASAVRFGNVPATSFVVESPERIRAVAPAHSEGIAAVTVTTPEGTSARSYQGAFHYGEGAWSRTGKPLGSARFGHTATVLDGTPCDASPPPGWCGKVLIAGGNVLGDHPYDTTSAVELFDPVTGTSSVDTCAEKPVSASCPEGLDSGSALHSATLLPDGRVLVVGGFALPGGVRSRAELYDPSSGRWHAAASLPPPTGAVEQGEGAVEEGTGENLVTTPVLGLLGHTATLLPAGATEVCGLGCGKVLVTGGARSLQPYEDGLNTAFLYDPREDEWTPAGPLLFGRFFHSALLLGRESCGQACGQVLLVGGYDGGGNHNHRDKISPPERYDGFRGTTLPRADWAVDRVLHTTHLLEDGRVLVAGGNTDYVNGNSLHLATDAAELYDPASDSWRSTQPLEAARFGHVGAVLPSGKVLVAGGSGTGPLATAELYDPALQGGQDAWRSAGSMLVPRTGQPPHGSVVSAAYDPTATLLSGKAGSFEADAAKCGENCGKVLVVGGSTEGFAELYTPEPTVTEIAPGSGPATGGTRVTIKGTGFTHDLREVRFGSAVVPCPSPNCTIGSYSELSVVAPASATSSNVPVTVANEGGRSAAPVTFAYTGPASTGGSRGALGTTGGGGAAGTRPSGRALRRQALRREALRRQTVRRRSLRGCLARARRHTERERRRARRGSILRRARAGAHSRRHGARLRRRCLSRHGRRPGRVTGLTARAVSGTRIVLTFRAPGTDGRDPPPPDRYVIKQATRPIRTAAGFRRARSLCSRGCRLPVDEVGATVKSTITDLKPGTTYYYVIAARDNVSRRLGPRSRMVSATTRR